MSSAELHVMHSVMHQLPVTYPMAACATPLSGQNSQLWHHPIRGWQCCLDWAQKGCLHSFGGVMQICMQSNPQCMHSEDEEMKQMVQEETEKIRTEMQSLEAQLEILLLPKDPLDERSIMLEVLSQAQCMCQHSYIQHIPVHTSE